MRLGEWTAFNTYGLTIGPSGTLFGFRGAVKYTAGYRLANGTRFVGPESETDKLEISDIIVGVLWRNSLAQFVVNGIVVRSFDISTAGHVIDFFTIDCEEYADVTHLAGRTFLATVNFGADQDSYATPPESPVLYECTATITWPTQWMDVWSTPPTSISNSGNSEYEEHTELSPLFWKNLKKLEMKTSADPIVLEPETETLLAAMTVQPAGGKMYVINSAIAALKDSGYWSRFDRFGIMKAAQNQQHGLLDWKDPTQSLALTGSASWNTTDGACGSLTGTSHVATGFNPTSDGVNYTQNDGSLNIYVTDDSSLSDHAALLGVSVSGYESLLEIAPGYDRISGKINSTGTTRNDADTLPATPFLVSIDRDGASSCGVSLNDVDVTTIGATNASNGLPNAELFMFSWNLGGSTSYQSDAKAAAWWVGGSFTGAERLEIIEIIDNYFAEM